MASPGDDSPRVQTDGAGRGRWGLRGLTLAGLAGVAALLAGCGGAKSSQADGSAAKTALVAIGAGLRGPAGLKASVYAQGPATTSAFAVDGNGRLWLTAAGLEAHAHDGVYVVAKGGARARKVVSGLKDPLGIVWDAGRLYVASVGRVDEYDGFDGVRFAEHREILRGPVAGGENNLLAVAPNGRLVMGVTATCDHCKAASAYSGSIVSFKANGSDLRIYASAIRAPVGLAFVPGTSDLLAGMNQRDDLGASTPGDWLALVREGESWGFPGCYGQGGAACSGVPQPTAVLDKHAAVGAIAVVSGRLAGGAGTSALVAEWSTSKVQRVSLVKSGSSYEGSVSSFLTGVRNPLAMVLAADGSLLVGDWATGTIYRVSA
ncbi:MAG: PQQ-dependent sugar dehydrogenase [Solirubrobacteraceae bacterium]